jgi:hypothetical protein
MCNLTVNVKNLGQRPQVLASKATCVILGWSFNLAKT